MVLSIVQFSIPQSSAKVSASSLATISTRFPVSMNAYSILGFRAIARFAGIVQGVVVQITIECSSNLSLSVFEIGKQAYIVAVSYTHLTLPTKRIV